MLHAPRHLIDELKTSNRYFSTLLARHNALEQRIRLIEAGLEAGTPDAIESLQTQQLAITDELDELLRHASLHQTEAAR